MRHFEESEILTNEEHRSTLKGWLPPPDGKWRLLFRASRDGFAGETFHSKCDNKGPTVTIVKSGNNIFGGFTEISWDSKLLYVSLFYNLLPGGEGTSYNGLYGDGVPFLFYRYIKG